MNAIGRLTVLANPNSLERIQLETILGARSFRHFFRMAWPHIDSAHLLWNWHIDLLCDEMEAVARREHLEAVFAIPPRSLKSQLISVAFPAWVWTWFPSAKFITCSYDMPLATRDAVKTRRLIQSDWYQSRWGPNAPFLHKVWPDEPEKGRIHPGVSLASDQANKTYYETTAGGHRFVATPGSNVTGHGADFITADDPHPTNKAESEAERSAVLRWWFETIPTRLNEPDRGVKMVIQQRVHREDLAGECIRRGYHKVVLPMQFEPDHPDRHPKDPRTKEGELLHPERVNLQALERLKAALGPYGVAGQLQMRPTARQGGLFQRRHFKILDALPAGNARVIRRWDLAATLPEPGTDPDWTVGAKVALFEDGRFIVVDIQRFRDEPAQVDQAIKAIAQQDGKEVEIVLVQDPGQAGKHQVAALTRFLAPYPVRVVQETGDKVTRARGLASQLGIGNVYLLRAAWNEALLDEFADFPNGAHDDQVDAVAGGFNDLFGGETGLLDYYRGLVADAMPEITPSNITVRRI